MNVVRYLLFFLVLGLSLPQPLSANEQGYGVRKITAYPTARGVSRIGKVTGESCRSDNDCIVGCASGQPDDLTCLTLNEASDECVSPDEAPEVDYPCACLSDVNRCGFVFSKNKIEQTPEHVMLLTQPVPPKALPAPVKKSPHKKTTRKKSAHKKKCAATPPAKAPTPVTEPTHDSGK